MGVIYTVNVLVKRLPQMIVGRTVQKPLQRVFLLVLIFVGVIVTVEMFGLELPLLSRTNRLSTDPSYLEYADCIDQVESLYEFKDGKLIRIKETGLKFADRNKTMHVAFLKVHKAGSTTIQNLMFRFGMRHDLNILLPKFRNYVRSKEAAMPLEPDEHYDIMAVHTTNSSEIFESLLPVDSVIIGVVREPVDRMISAAYYYRDVWRTNYLKKVPELNFIHHLVQQPEKYETSFFSYTRNSMGHDFGFDEIKSTERNYVQKYLDELNSRFLLVLIFEKFEESLLLLRRLLGWSISDILYLETNTYSHNHALLSKDEIKKLRQTSFLDFEIYEFFLKMFNEKLKRMQPDFWEEVKFFKTVLRQVKEFCLKFDSSKNDKLVIRRSNWDDEFKLSSSQCVWMKTKELPFIAKLRTRQDSLHQR